MIHRCFISALLACALFAAGPVGDVAHADDKNKVQSRQDHDDALSARADGSILPLPEVLGRVGPQIEGEIIETEFENEDGRPVYEFKYVDRKGRVRELYVDARSGTILSDKPD